MTYRRIKHQVNYAPNAIYHVENWIQEHPHTPFFGSFPAPGPKPPKEAFLLAAQRLRNGVTSDDFMVGNDCRIRIVPRNGIDIMIDILEPEEAERDSFEERQARFIAEDTLRRQGIIK